MQSPPPTSLADSLAATFGADGAIVSPALGSLYRALDGRGVPDDWATLFGLSDKPLSKRQQKRLSELIEDIDEPPERARFFFALHTYLAVVLKLTLCRAVDCVRARTTVWDEELLSDIETGAWFREAIGARNVGGEDPFGWYLESDSPATVEGLLAVARAVDRIDDDVIRGGIGQGRDVFKALYEALIPRTVRRTLGEHYTPNWLAEHLVDQLFEAVETEQIGRALDPSCGSGTFLLELVGRSLTDSEDLSIGELFDTVAGYDLNPLAVLAARTNLLLATLDRAAEYDARFTVPVYCQDALEAEPPERAFDVIVGNPPWINWQGLPEQKRAQLQPLWEDYGLFVHKGFDTILGKGKKEFATLFTAAVVDRYLADGGKIAFVITQGVWKAAGASEGFRRLDFGGAFDLGVDRVEDLSSFKVFDSATTRTTTFVATRGRRVEFPVEYVYWRRVGRRARLDSQGSIDDALEHAERIELAAEPYEESAPESPWITARPAAIDALRRLFGESAYQARQGVNTGGGNAVFWLRIMQRTTLGHLRVENILKGAKKKVEQIRVELEPDYVFPLIRGRDVSRWHAEGDRHILMVQDPETRRGVLPETLRETAPETLAYLEHFEEFLRGRALFRRYFMRGGEPTGPWWSMFGVGEYTLLPWKVVWAGQVATHLDCAVVGPEGAQLTLPDQTAYYVGVETEREADFLCGLLNSAPLRLLYRSFLYKHVSLSFIETLDLPAFDAEQSWMCALADAAREARRAAASGHDEAVLDAEQRIDALACNYWGINDRERAEVARSLERLG